MKIQHAFFFLVVVVLVFLCSGCLSQQLQEDNVCNSAEHRCWFIKYMRVSTTTHRRAWYCFFLCRVEYIEFRLVKEKKCGCCPGWVTEDGSCTECPEGTYGRNCEEQCSCGGGDDYLCNRVDGFCLLRSSANCTGATTACPELQNCNDACINGQKCNHTSNVCECPPGWRDDDSGTCNFMAGCSDGYFGPECEQPCECENNATCDVLTGSCDCPAGWTGLTCNDPCEPGSYGRNCSKMCECPDNALECSVEDGSCLCPQGFYGRNCSIQCPDGYYGSNCQHNCSCDEQFEACDLMNRTCRMKRPDQPTTTPGIDSDPDVPGGVSSSVTGAVIGGVIAGISVCVLIGCLLFIRVRRRRKQAKENRSDGNLVTISHDVSYENAEDVKGEEHDMAGGRHQGNAYALAFQSPPQRFIVGGTAYAMPEKSNPHAPGVSDDVTKPVVTEEEYCYVNRGKTNEFDDNDEALKAKSAGMVDQYSHLERGQRAENMRSAKDYGILLQSGEQDGEYSHLDRREMRRGKDHGEQYEVVGVQ